MPNTLTPADIDALQGRELDAAVAENIMGLCWHDFEPKNKTSQRAKKFVCSKCGLSRFGGDAHTPPHYSESRQAIAEFENEIERRGLTWEYVEALSEIVAPGYAHVFSSVSELEKREHYICGSDLLWRIAHASTEQRCRAALKAVGG